MRKELDNPIKISTGSPIIQPEVQPQPRQLRSGLVRDLGARADKIVEIDYGNGRVTYHDRGPSTDDIYLAHSARAIRLRDY